MIKLEGIVNRIIYKNPVNHYTVIEFETPDFRIFANGIIYSASAGERLVLEGEYTEHLQYGKQFKFSSFLAQPPEDIDSIKQYLKSGMLPGIGEKKAEDLISHFGADVLKIIEHEPQRLSEVKGIGHATAMNVREAFAEQYAVRNIIISLGRYGLSSAVIMKLYEKYGQNTAAVVEQNPYQLIEDVQGIGFQRADAIAEKVGIKKDSEMRLKAGIQYYMHSMLQQGDCYCLKEKLLYDVSRRLEVPYDSAEQLLYDLSESGKIVPDSRFDEDRYYLPYVYEAEAQTARKIAQLCSRNSQAGAVDSRSLILRYEQFTGIKLEEKQIEAAEAAINNRIILITGGPGTGKTTIIKAIIYILSLTGRSFVLAAPTGRAAKKITQTCGYEAKTIHRMLEYGYSADDDQVLCRRDEDNCIEEDNIIIDEMSMVDIDLFSKLLNAVDTSVSSLILVGDKDQLPAVGAGNVLSDLLESGIIPTVTLTQIYRQAQESLLITNAHLINSGELPVMNDEDGQFIFIDEPNQTRTAETLLQLIEENKYDAKTLMQSENLQIISPLRRGDAGVDALNRRLQEIMNPKSFAKKELSLDSFVLRTGDKVMQTKNNYSTLWRNTVTGAGGEGIFNGDLGYIDDLDLLSNKASIIFDGDRHVYLTFSELENITLAYAITIHKSQGCEFDTVIIPAIPSHPDFLTRNLLYTAVTRAKKQVIIIGQQYVITSMVKNSRSRRRLSGLSDRLSMIIRN